MSPKAELARVIPSQATRVLIYCNNNFSHEQQAFPSKVARASLNIYSFNTLYSYGYTNIYRTWSLARHHQNQASVRGDLGLAVGTLNPLDTKRPTATILLIAARKVSTYSRREPSPISPTRQIFPRHGPETLAHLDVVIRQ